MINLLACEPRQANGQPAAEPIAIIGLGCHFPGGVHDWQSYWRLLDAGVDAITETPPDRWNLQKFYSADVARPGRTQSKWGGYVSAIDQFDPQLFGISPREAASMDPQQRLLLGVAFRALEDAGQPLSYVAGQPVSVHVGISSFDYAVAGLSFQDRGVIDTYSNTGGSSSIAANRISYCFDLRGPSMAIDTACSSSLVALHMACESLRRGEARMALAGGVNALLLPDFYVAFSQLGVLSPDGRCKAFDARANGYVRSEGAGMVLLKPLNMAIRDSDPIYAVIRGSALNQDGRTPGMTVPSQAAQEQLLRAACGQAHVSPSQIQYVEAHGTGTPVGDPIEATALGNVLGQDRPRHHPCWIGSVKTNIGHLEAGAGIAAVIKVALALHHRRIPAHLHFQKANPNIEWDRLGLRVPTESIPWDSDGSRFAGINSFGYGGANAHVIMEQAPVGVTRTMQTCVRSGNARSAAEPAPSVSGFDAPVLLPLSARNKAALLEHAEQLADWLSLPGNDLHLAEIAGFMAHRRTHHEVRASVCAVEREQIVAELRTMVAAGSDLVVGELSPSQLDTGLAFVCSGQGPQWWAMGRGLLRYSPAFRSVIKRCDGEFARYASWSLLTELSRPEATSRMQQTSIAQPSLFAIQIALAAVWESWGIRPTAVVGHSVGEIAAAYLTGGLSFEDACLVAFHRGRTMDLASSQGAMLAAGLSAEEVPAWIADNEADVSLAAINGPSSVTISGAAVAIEQLAQRLEREGIFCRRLAVEYAFHSPQMEPVREELLRSLAGLRPQPTHTSLISTVTGQPIDGQQLDADYWWRNVRQSVRFSDAMSCLAERGHGVAVEVGPHPVLAYAINECFAAAGCRVKTVPSLNRQQDDLQVITKSLGNLYTFGFDIRWTGFYNRPVRPLPVPTYPFQLQRCWSESSESRSSRLSPRSHPLLGERVDDERPQWQQRVDIKLHPYLADHRVRAVAVYPAAAVLETALAAGLAVHQSETVCFDRLRLDNPCVLSDDKPQWLKTTYLPSLRQLQIDFRDCQGDDWQRLSLVNVSSRVPPAQPNSEALQAVRMRCRETFDGERLYRYCQSLGLQYGAAFQSIKHGLRRAGEALAQVELAESLSTCPDTADYRLHPALLDGCFHAMIAADGDFDHQVDGLYLPKEMRSVAYYRRPTQRATVHARLLSKTAKRMVCDLDIYDEHERICLTIRGFESQRVQGTGGRQRTEDLIYSYSWQPQPVASDAQLEPGAPTHWLLLMDEGGIGRELSQRLLRRGDRVYELYRQRSRVAQSAAGKFFQVDPESLQSLTDGIRSALREADGRIDNVVYLWGLDAPASSGLTAESLEQSTPLTTLAPMHLVQAWEQVDEAPPAELTIVTAGAQSREEEPELTCVAQAPLIGLGRVIISEVSRFRTQLVDLPRERKPQDIDHLLTEFAIRDDEDEIMWRGAERFVRRFGPQADKPLCAAAARGLPNQLHVGNSAGIEELHYRSKPTAALARGQVEIEVAAAGLNFSDVMKALDLYPGLPDGPVALGAECSGRISRVGPGSMWSVGDEVLAVAPGSFATHVVVDEALVARRPSRLTAEQAATIPIAFLTADYALHECARMQAGESVLIHAASGGVGLAALQLARAAGVKVYATAGTEEKREFVRQQGAALVMDSRSLNFGDEILRDTAGAGVDVVLNSLPGEAIAVGLSVLKTGGRFLEIGKRDIYTDMPLGLYPFRNNLAMFAIDLDQLFKQQPRRMGGLLARIAERFEQGELQALPTSLYDADETTAAFKYMQQGKHIGKLAVNYARRPAKVRAGEIAPVAFHADRSYWIAGGLGGFGLQIARWMVTRGARHIVLSGRSQGIPPQATEALRELEEMGATVRVMPADIARVEDVRRVLARIDAELPPLAGVLHTAMVLEDKLLADLDRATLDRVLRPKVLGGWNLHQQTLGRPLDCFILFSSLSSIFGHAGQANYSAANALLDSLAYHRRAQGLPALVVNWGHLGEVGYLAEREELGQRLQRQGVLSFNVRQATDCLEYAMQTMAIQLSVLRIDWSVWRGLGLTHRVSPRFAHLLKHASEGPDDSAMPIASAEALRAVVGLQRFALVDRLLRSKAGSLLGIPAEQIPVDRSLLELGLDSLMAVEMRNWIESHMQIAIPIAALLKNDSLSGVAERICEAIGQASQPYSTHTASTSETGPIVELTGDDPQSLLEALPGLPDDQVSQLLGQMLRERD